MHSLIILAALVLTACAGNGPDTIVVRPPEINLTEEGDVTNVIVPDPVTNDESSDTDEVVAPASTDPCAPMRAIGYQDDIVSVSNALTLSGDSSELSVPGGGNYSGPQMTFSLTPARPAECGKPKVIRVLVSFHTLGDQASWINQIGSSENTWEGAALYENFGGQLHQLVVLESNDYDRSIYADASMPSSFLNMWLQRSPDWEDIDLDGARDYKAIAYINTWMPIGMFMSMSVQIDWEMNDIPMRSLVLGRVVYAY